MDDFQIVHRADRVEILSVPRLVVGVDDLLELVH